MTVWELSWWGGSADCVGTVLVGGCLVTVCVLVGGMSGDCV